MEKYNLTQTGQEVQDILDNATPQSDLASEVERAQEAERLLGEGIQQNADDIDAIEGKIPSAASSENQLADKSFVNSSIATATATFRGTFNLVIDLDLTVDATEQQIATALAGAISTADNNDYAFVQIPTSDETPTDISEIDRYKFNGTTWAFEYALNNSGFTAAEWAAINSGITSELVTKLGNLPTAAALAEALASKQNVLTFDSVPTEGSNNPVKSGGVYSAIDEEKGARLNSDAALQQSIEAILLLIPTAASSLNQLADKAFVNSSIATNTATFRGTFNLVNDLHLTLAATHAQVGNALALAIQESDNNDYAFVQIPTVETAPNEIAQTDRYKFNGSTWEYEYTLNNSGFTSAQWIAINSGITEALVTKLSALPTNTELTTALGVLTSSITTINQKIPSAASQANQLVDIAAMESYIVQVLDVLTASFNVTSSDGHVTVQISQVDGKITSFALTTLDIASAASLSLVEGRVTTAEGNISTNSADIAILQDAYAALTQSALVVVQPTDTWPVASPATSTIYRVVDRTNTPPQYYSDYMWNGTAMVLMATYDNAIDPRPKKGSLNLVTSGGVFDNMGALDVSELNATENPHTLATYADLSAALAAIPTDYQKGGMSIKFVQSSDHKYVQYRLMAQNFTTNTTQWQGVDDEPTAGSDNLVKSGSLTYLGFKHNGYINGYQSGIESAEWTDVNSSDRQHYIIPISSELAENRVSVTSNNIGSTILCFLTDYNVVEGSSANAIGNYLAPAANQTLNSIIPVGTKYIYLLCKSGVEDRTPSSLKIGDTEFINNASIKGVTFDLLAKDLLQNQVNKTIMPYRLWSLGNRPNIDTANNTLTFSDATTITVGNTSYTIPAGTVVSLTTEGTAYSTILFKLSDGTFVKILRDAEIDLNQYILFGFATTTARKYYFPFNYTIDGVDTEELSKKSYKQFRLWSSGDKPNVDSVNNTLTFSSATTVTVGSTDYTIPAGTVVNLVASGSTYSTIMFKLSDSTFHSITRGVGSTYNALEYLLFGFAVTGGTNTKKRYYFPFSYTIDGADVETLKGQVDTLKGQVDSINESICKFIFPFPVFELGNIMFTNNDFEYRDATTRIRTQVNVFYENKVGDIEIYLSDYTYAKLGIFYQDSDGSNKGADVWINSGKRTLRYGKKYAFIIAYKDDRVITDISELSSLLVIDQPFDKVNELYDEVFGTGILSLNNEREVLTKIKNLKTHYVSYGSSANYPNIVSFLHFSDLHNNNVNLLRIKDFVDEYSSYIDDVIQTGDLVGGVITDKVPASWPTVGSNWLSVIGNHDATIKVNNLWTTVSSKDSYDEVFAPYISNWGVVQPTGATENGYCYYYKDYSASNLRLIVLDNMQSLNGGPTHWDGTQKTWFENTLADAKNNGLHVIVAFHYIPFAMVHNQAVTSFDSIDMHPDGSGWHVSQEIPNAVKDFIDAGGIFVCYICGHTHMDFFGVATNADWSNQLAISIASASYVSGSGVYGESNRDVGTKGQDCFNIIGIDTTSKTIKLMRVGMEYDRYMRRKNTLSWNYGISQLIYTD